MGNQKDFFITPLSSKIAKFYRFKLQIFMSNVPKSKLFKASFSFNLIERKIGM